MTRKMNDAELETVNGGLTQEEADMFNIDLDRYAGDSFELEEMNDGTKFKRRRTNLKTS